MTILVGFKLDNGTILIADNKNVNIDREGNMTGGFSNSEKISHIRKNMIMSTAGLGQVGSSVAGLLDSALNVNENISVQDAIPYISETLNFGHGLFKRVNSDVTYLNLVALVGGYDLEESSSFLYAFSGENEFKPRLLNGSFIVLGAGQAYVQQYMQNKFKEIQSMMDVIRVASEAIRNLNEPTVSKDITALVSFYDNTDKSFKFLKIYVDENGIVQR